ncbi:MAG: DUF4250 domain-containing protein [Oscillospiraceae bacterium]|nr:DUF4250 domain-containing protein [Oscillospiraceae bacterium]
MLPKDPNILFSMINTYLRDKYPSLDALCDDLGEGPAEIKASLASIGYEYDPEKNCFIKVIV